MLPGAEEVRSDALQHLGFSRERTRAICRGDARGLVEFLIIIAK